MAICERDLRECADHQYDVLIIGGGISGAWIALHCAELGYDVALIEKEDFGSQTSAASSKLIHSGIRYLQQLQLNKVRESALERAHYLYASPHLCRPVQFLVPTYKGLEKSQFLMRSGMTLYNLLRLGEKRILDDRYSKPPNARFLSRRDFKKKSNTNFPGNTGAVEFEEYQMYDSERMTLSVLLSAQSRGAKILNYCEAIRYAQTGNCIGGIIVRDRIHDAEYVLQGKLTINAAGPWVDHLNQQLSLSRKPLISHFGIGSHILLNKKLSDYALALTTDMKSNAKIDRGGRHVFMIPWREHTLIGTSYHEMDNNQYDLTAAGEHISQLLEAINQALPDIQLSRKDIMSSFTGLYPIKTNERKQDIYQGSGEYKIFDHENTDNIKGLITALGAKFTTARKLAEITTKLVTKKISGKLITPPQIVLDQAQYANATQQLDDCMQRHQDIFTQKQIEHLFMNYGSDLDKFIAFTTTSSGLLKQIIPGQPDIYGQIAWAVKYEMAQTLDDVLYRRTSLGHFNITSAEVNSVALLMGELLDWSKVEIERQTASFIK